MSAIKVLAIQLRQIQSQLETVLDRQLWETEVLLPADCAGMAARLDTARFAVSMAAIRAEAVVNANAKPLPVCADDKPEPRVGDWFRMPLYNGGHADAVVRSCVAKGDGAVEMEMLTKCGETLRGIWSRAEWQSLRRIPRPQPTGGAA